MPAARQARVGLLRRGAHGSSSSVNQAASHFGASAGQDAHATARATAALKRIAPLLSRRPDEEEREPLGRHAEGSHGFKGWAGSVDGATIRLFHASGWRPRLFFDSRRKHSPQTLSSVGHELRIIDAIVGHLGPAAGSKAQAAAVWQQQRRALFSPAHCASTGSALWATKGCSCPGGALFRREDVQQPWRMEI